MIENLQDELYQLENKQTKTFLTMPQDFLQSTWKIEYAKSNNIGVASTDDINQSILAALRTFSNLQKKKKKKKKKRNFLHQGDNFQSCNYWIS